MLVCVYWQPVLSVELTSCTWTLVMGCAIGEKLKTTIQSAHCFEVEAHLYVVPRHNFSRLVLRLMGKSVHCWPRCPLRWDPILVPSGSCILTADNSVIRTVRHLTWYWLAAKECVCVHTGHHALYCIPGIATWRSLSPLPSGCVSQACNSPWTPIHQCQSCPPLWHHRVVEWIEDSPAVKWWTERGHMIIQFLNRNSSSWKTGLLLMYGVKGGHFEHTARRW